MPANTDSIPVLLPLTLPRRILIVKAVPTEATPAHSDRDRERREREWMRRAQLMQGFMIR